MHRKKILLGTTALLTVGALAVGTASAAEVAPLGALDLNIGGFARWYLFLGDLKDKSGRSTGSYDMRTDTEVYVYVRGRDEATGLEYGANIELEADTNSTADSDEMFTFIKGNFGEFRFGDDDGAADNGKVGAFTIAAFSGGLDAVGPFDLPALVDGADSGDDTKLTYYTPDFAGFQLGASWTPHVGDSGTSIGTTDSGSADDLFEGMVSYKGNFGDVGILASVIGSYGHANTPGEGDDETYKIYGGAAVTAFGFKFAGGTGYQKGARPLNLDADGASQGNYIGGVTFARDASYKWYNLGVGGTFGPANVSLNWGQVYDTDGGENFDSAEFDEPEPQALILGADVGVAPGLVVGGEVQWFDNRDNTSGDNGVLGLVGVRVAF